jgi:hypothetical protein
MSDTSGRGHNIIGSQPGAAPDKETDRDTVEAVIKAFTAAHGRLAFEAALRGPIAGVIRTRVSRWPAAASPRSFVLQGERNRRARSD